MAAEAKACSENVPGIDTNVVQPAHYKTGGIETIEFIKAKLTPEEFNGLCVGNIIKYVTRARYKNGIEDIKKARQYCDYLIQAAEGESK